MATADGNVLHQHSGDIKSKDILKPKQKLCSLDVEESYGESAGFNWNLHADGWSIENKLFNVSTLTIGVKLFNDIVADLLNQKLITDLDLFNPDDTICGCITSDDDYYDGREYFSNTIHNFIPVLEMEQQQQLQYDEDGITSSTSTTIKNEIVNSDESRFKEFNNDWNNNNNGVNGKVIEPLYISNQNTQLNNDCNNNNNNGVNGTVIEPFLNFDQTAQLCSFDENALLNLNSGVSDVIKPDTPQYSTVKNCLLNVHEEINCNICNTYSSPVKNVSLQNDSISKNAHINNDEWISMGFTFTKNNGECGSYGSDDTCENNENYSNHSLDEKNIQLHFPDNCLLKFCHLDTGVVLFSEIFKLIEHLLQLQNLDNYHIILCDDLMSFVNSNEERDYKELAKQTRMANNWNNETRIIFLSQVMKILIRDIPVDAVLCNDIINWNGYHIFNHVPKDVICKDNNKINKINFDTPNGDGLSSLNVEYGDFKSMLNNNHNGVNGKVVNPLRICNNNTQLNKNLNVTNGDINLQHNKNNHISSNFIRYRKKRGRKKSKYKWVIKNKLQNAHFKQFDKYCHVIPFGNVSDISNSQNSSTNSSSSSDIVDENSSFGGSIIEYGVTAPAPPCDPDLMVNS